MDILQELKKRSKLDVRFKMKDYKSTYISILRTRSYLKVSVHSLFNNAPEEIKSSVVSYCLTRDKKAHSLIKKYANEHFIKADYTHRVNTKNLITQGSIYDLKKIMDTLNFIYFKNELDLKITYSKPTTYKKFRHITFGSFDKNQNLIRINRILDSNSVPFYFINYIVYHEMLHYVCKEKIDDNGNRRVHTKEFKEKEKEFAYFSEATKFAKNFLKKGYFYGRT